MKTEVLVNGGGVGGLALAVKLASQGVHTTVVEQLKAESPSYKGELLQPKTLAILDDLGVLQEVLPSGHALDQLQFIELERQVNTSPKTIGQSNMDYSLLQSPYNYALMIPHEKLKSILLHKANEYKSYFTYIQPARFRGFEGDKAIVRHSREDRDYHIHASFYVGAEGRTSPTRQAMGLSVKNRTYNHHFLTVTFSRPEDFIDGKIVTTNHRFLGLFPLPNDQIRTVFLIKAGAYKEMKKEGIELFHNSYAELCPELQDHVLELEDWKRIQLMIPNMYHVSKYVSGNMALIGDAAHAVHPMAGEGMNLAIQDADVLGELLGWMKRNHKFDNDCLQWYEQVRRPRAQFLLNLSHLSALAYSFPYRFFRRIRMKSIERIEQDSKLHVKQMLNISGLGRWDENAIDRFVQIGLMPKRSSGRAKDKQMEYFFQRSEDYPWEREE
ncbi:FAD-dependent oxidoreductase [Pontibacillus halophilus JSM 076056 = DSM 19796]|uniref:FAD-dependent oxidoreductase n=1 Tax=Pontibacillus halophilus JSM 076056 = DSM 19796 TaxID=1385510 RepID=A0A0A5GI79_9BACI|nr:FAD-dependent monooxygenase [Pontibacillus halophilus]KGX92946.1 FAD-dependent oxidoreductase [Pontibacillus halophilus JSM 076056 = DSM 19796]